eukprot:Amastigsp_a3370_123.p4 type:complete len:101 gc:universal Amastigsp_a3370_123:1321-1019(-)
MRVRPELSRPRLALVLELADDKQGPPALALGLDDVAKDVVADVEDARAARPGELCELFQRAALVNAPGLKRTDALQLDGTRLDVDLAEGRAGGEERRLSG